jgi:hypothetical protein
VRLLSRNDPEFSFNGCVLTCPLLSRYRLLFAPQVAEFAAPHELLQDPTSVFSSLVEELGPETAAAMRRAAEEAYRVSGRAAPPTELPGASA